MNIYSAGGKLVTINDGRIPSFASLTTSDLILNLDAGDRLSYSGSGSTWTDLSGLNNNGTLQNSPTFSYSNKGYLSFNGSDQYVTVGAIGNFATSDTTLAAQIYPTFDSASFGRIIIGKSSSCSSTDIAIDYGRFANKFAVITRDDITLVSSKTYAKNNWYYLTITKKNNGDNTYTYKLYVDGRLDNSATVNYGGSGGSATLDIGRAPGCFPTVPTWLGRISVVHIYNRTLKDNEVNDNYVSLLGRLGL